MGGKFKVMHFRLSNLLYDLLSAKYIPIKKIANICELRVGPPNSTHNLIDPTYI